MDGKVKCLNPWDVQSKHIVTPEGVSESLCAGEKRYGSLPPQVAYDRTRVMGVDVYNFKVTGDIACNLNASSCNSPTHSGPSVLVLNDQGGRFWTSAEMSQQHSVRRNTVISQSYVLSQES